MPGEVVGRAEYQLGADLKPLVKELGVAESSIKKSGKAAEDAFGKQATGAAGKLSNALGFLGLQSGELKKSILTGVGMGAGIGAFSLLSSAIGNVVGGLGAAARAAAEEQTAIATMVQSIKANDAAWDGNIAKIEERISAGVKLAFSDDSQRASLQKLVSVTKDTDAALGLLSQAMDLARLRGMDLGTAGDLLGKVYAGNMGTLSRYGIVLEKGATATEALAEIQKRAQGQAKTYASEGIGAIEAAELRQADAMERIGAIAIPVVTAIADVAASAVEAVAGLVEGIGDLADAAIDFIDSGRDTRAELEAIADTLDTKSARSLMSYQKALQLSGEEGDYLRTKLDGLSITAGNQASLMQHLGVIAASSGEELAVVTDQAVKMTDALEIQNFVMMSTEERVAAWRLGVGGLYDYFGVLNPLIEDNTAAVVDNSAKMSEATTIYLGWLHNTELGRAELERLNASYDVLSSAIPPADQATKDITVTFDQLWNAAGKLGSGLDDLGPSLRDGITSAKDDVSEAMADLRWSMEHPFADDAFAKWLEKRAAAAMAMLARAIRQGRPEAVAEAAATRIAILEELNAIDPGAGTQEAYRQRRREQGYPTRASGGWVAPGAYQINERGTEMLLMSGRGYILDAGKTQAALSGAAASTTPTRHEHYHHIDGQSAQNLAAAGFDTAALAQLLRGSTSQPRYGWGT